MIKLSLHFFVFFAFAAIAFEPRPLTPYPVVGYKEVSFFDDFHDTSRKLLIWYPVDPQTDGTASSNPWDLFKVALKAPIASPKEKKRIIIISHGYGGNPHQLSWLTKKLVYNNYIVIGIQHLDIIDHKPQINHWQRPQDIHKMIDLFSLEPIAVSADLRKIGIAGFSLGGTTAIWLGGGRSTKLDTIVPGTKYVYPAEFNGLEKTISTLDKGKMSANWRDERIKAAFIMAPAWGWIFHEEDLKKISIPTYITASDADDLLVTPSNAGYFAQNIPRCIYKTISGKVMHNIFISNFNKSKNGNIKLPSQLDFLADDDLTVDRSWIQFEVAGEATDFFNAIFAQEP